MMIDKVWYSPLTLIRMADFALKNSTNSKVVKKADEALPIIVATVGLRRLTGKEYWLQLVKDSERTPDIRAMSITPNPNGDIFTYIDIEVVTLEEHSDEDVAKFILNKKLENKRKAYDASTVFVCHINRSISTSVEKIHEGLKVSSKSNDVYIVAVYKNDTRRYIFAQVHPNKGAVLKVDMGQQIETQLPAIKAIRKGAIEEVIASKAPNPFLQL